MPFINKNSSIPNKPEPFKRPNGPIKRMETKDESLFHGRSQISRYEFNKSLEGNKEIRTDLAKKLNLKTYSPEMDAEIKKMEKRIPKRFGGFISPAEAKKSMVEEYWNKKHEMEEKLKGGVSAKEIKEITKREKEDEFLKKITKTTKTGPIINAIQENLATHKNLGGQPINDFIKVKKERIINKPIKQKLAPSDNESQLSESEVEDEIDDQENKIFPFATRKYDPGKAMSSAKEQSFSKIKISGKKSKGKLEKSPSKPKLSELRFQEKFKVEEILDKAREHGLLHPPLKSGALSPDEIRQYEILELEKMFPRYFGGISDKTKASKMIEEFSWNIRHMEKNPKNWEKVALEENKLKFLKDIGNIKDSPS